MIWARRIINPAECNQVQDQFESLFVKLGCPGQMLLVAISSPVSTMLFASLPHSALLNALTGFDRIDDSELPSEASLLVGHHHAFKKFFTYPKWKPTT
jgi:hypothetical protein